MINTKKNNQEKKVSGISIFLSKYYKFIIGFLSLIIIIPAVLMLIKPEYLKTKNLSAQQLPQKEQKLQDLNMYYQDLDSLVKNLDSLQQKRQDDFDKLKKILPSQADFASLFAQMEAMFADKDYEILTIAFSETPLLISDNPEAGEQKIGRVDISLNASGGGYFEFKELLDNIEKHFRIMDVTAIGFGDIYPDSEESQGVAYVLTIGTYYLP